MGAIKNRKMLTNTNNQQLLLLNLQVLFFAFIACQSFIFCNRVCFVGRI